jgi:hypothetical protein
MRVNNFPPANLNKFKNRPILINGTRTIDTIENSTPTVNGASSGSKVDNVITAMKIAIAKGIIQLQCFIQGGGSLLSSRFFRNIQHSRIIKVTIVASGTMMNNIACEVSEAILIK